MQQKREYNYPLNLIEKIMGEIFDSELPSDYRGTLEYLLAENLTEREQQIISMRYRSGMTYEAMGNNLNVSRERIRQIEQKAIRKLRGLRSRSLLRLGISGSIEDAHQKALDKERERYQKLIDAMQERGTKDVKVIEIEAQNVLIENMDLSIRAYNCLKRAGFSTLKDIICCSREEISKIKNMDAKSVDELEKKIFSYGFGWEIIPKQKIDAEGVLIEQMGLSIRTYNCLLRAGFSTLKGIICCSKEEIRKIKNMGAKSVDELEKKIFSYGLDWASTPIASTPETAARRKSA